MPQPFAVTHAPRVLLLLLPVRAAAMRPLMVLPAAAWLLLAAALAGVLGVLLLLRVRSTAVLVCAGAIVLLLVPLVLVC